MSIIFRLDKNFDNILEQKKNILKILLLLLNASSELIFTFNGDNLLLMKNSNDILINKYYGFWDNQELEKMFNKLNYNEIHENEEIEYYPIK
jgi:arabinogalactan endo-1,4-beta-galactosidase